MSNNILTLSLRPDVTVLAVPVPDDAWDITLLPLSNSVMWWHKGFESDGVRFEPGSYELIGLLREFNDAEELAVLNTAIHSAGGDPKQNWLLIKKIA